MCKHVCVYQYTSYYILPNRVLSSNRHLYLGDKAYYSLLGGYSKLKLIVDLFLKGIKVLGFLFCLKCHLILTSLYEKSGEVGKFHFAN